MKFLPRSLALLSVTTLALLAPGCASTQSPAADAKPADAKVTTEYEYIKVTGSNLPVRVPKNGKPLPAASPTTNMSAENFESVVQQGMRDAPGKN